MREVRRLLRPARWRGGRFPAANTFPKSRETRAPLVEELYRFRDRLPEKLRYLADAPQQDPEGNKTLVRFSRKTKQQYVSSEKEGKATGWSAFFIDGKWTEAKSNLLNGRNAAHFLRLSTRTASSLPLYNRLIIFVTIYTL